MKTFKLVNKVLLVMIFLTLFFMTFGLTYSYFRASLEDKETDTTLTIDSGILDMEYSGGPEINASGLSPSAESFATKNFTIAGTSNITSSIMHYMLTITIDENTFTDNAISFALLSTNSDGNGEIVPSINEKVGLTSENYILGIGNFQGKITSAVHSYELKFYFEDTGVNQKIDMDKTFKAHITAEKYMPPEPTLADKILEQNGGVNVIAAKSNPTYSSVPTTGNTGMYASDDEYGPSYYYRGLKTNLNNNLIFAGYQWKIIRINGDRSIRVIYNGVCANDTCSINNTGSNTVISSAVWNTSNRNDNKYVRYMYGGSNGSSSNSSTITNNQTSTNAKTQLDNWYNTNIASKSSAASLVVDNIFCNDRSRTSGNGYGTSSTTYTPYTRLYSGTRTPTLKCSDQNNRFTVNDDIGNKALTYPVGLISADEASMAGMVRGTNNTTGYLYTNVTYWTMSPYNYASSTANLFMINTSGQLASNGVTTAAGFRPVINLSSETLVTGSGSTADPYIVKIPN